MATKKTADQYETEQAAEYGKYTAIVPIDYFGLRAFNVGDPVPASSVDGDDAWVPKDFVATSGAYQGSQTVPPPEPPAIDPTTVAAPAVSSPTPPTGD
jgi:hypothetical protein